MIIAIVSNKGGVGKTTSAITISHLLSLKHKTLLIDSDAQCNATSIMAPRLENLRTLYDVYTDTHVSKCIYPTGYTNLSIIPNTSDTTALEPSMTTQKDLGYGILRNKIKKYAEENFKYTIIDCPPNLGLFTVQSMICADSVIVPVEAGSTFAIDGLEKTMSAIKSIQDSYHPNLKLLKILITMADLRTTVDKVSVELLRQKFGSLIFDTIVSRNTDVKQAEMFRKTVIRYNPRSPAAKAYKKVIQELFKLLK